MNILDEVERAVDDGVNIYKNLTKDNRLVGGCGALEVELFRGISKFSEESSGLDQYAIKKFAESFLIIPKTLAENSGLNANQAISNLISLHEEGKTEFGIDVLSLDGIDVLSSSLLDCYSTKYFAIKLATQAVLNILSIDQIIMARPAGGPRLPKQQSDSMDADDDNI